MCVRIIYYDFFKKETRQTVRSNALSFLQAVLPEEPGLLHRGGDGGGDCRCARGEGRRACEDAVCKRTAGP